MLSTLLIVLGLVLLFLTVMIGAVFMIAGGFRGTFANVKVLIASGVIGLLMITLGVLPWEIAAVAGTAIVAVGGFAFFFFIRSSSYEEEKFRREVLKMREYISREHIGPVLHYLIRIGVVIGAILLCDVVGLSVFLLSKGQWKLPSFMELLTVLLLLEGSIIGAAGAFMSYGFSEYGVFRQAAYNPAIARDQAQRWKERRQSQQEWGSAMLIAGVLLVFLGLLVSFLTAL